MKNNQTAFLDMLAFSEIGPALLSISDNGYNVIVGSTPAKPILFSSYDDHPRRMITIKPGLVSSASGRYQLLGKYFDAYKKQLRLPDFSPASQDAIALQQIKECRAIALIDAGLFRAAVTQCARIWASLPGAGYGQHENKLLDLQSAYLSAGGTLAIDETEGG